MSENPVSFSLPDDTGCYTLHAARLACCGLVMKIGSHLEGAMTPDEIQHAADFNIEKIKYWFENRTKRHRCELVSDDNPMVLTPNGVIHDDVTK
jgi:hypothetical protein